MMILAADQFHDWLGEDLSWACCNIPLFECPDANLEETYYFRWRILRKHIKPTPDGTIITEFLPQVEWSGKHNSIVCPAGHHYREARWLHDRSILDDYSLFWFCRDGESRMYSTWLAYALYERCLVTGDWELATDLLPELVANWEAWGRSHQHPCGLFWSHDDSDGMEISISGDGFRPTLNSYMYGDAIAIARIASRVGALEVAHRFETEAAQLKRLIQDRLWDPQSQYFKVFPHSEGPHMSGSQIMPEALRNRPVTDWSFHSVAPANNVRELLGYVPFYFHLPDPGHEVAWKLLMDPNGFLAPFGLTTAECRHPRFMYYHPHSCQWNGPSWPFATTQTLVALANLLNDYRQEIVTREDYFQVLLQYAQAQHLRMEDGSAVPWIDENLHPDTGEWLARRILYLADAPDKDRGRDYNHSGFCDLVINGLIGLRPREDDMLVVNPLVPEGMWDYFCLDRVPYHGHLVTILFDRDGRRYGMGVGMRILVDGTQLASAERLKPVKVQLVNESMACVRDLG